MLSFADSCLLIKTNSRNRYQKNYISEKLYRKLVKHSLNSFSMQPDIR